MTYDPQRQPHDPSAANPQTGPPGADEQPTRPHPPDGYTVPAYGQAAGFPQPPPPVDDRMGKAALILGILAIAGGCIPLGIPAVICGKIALNRVARGEAGNRPLALIGYILGWVATGVTIALALLFTVMAVVNTVGN
ncbi:MAG: DUF4190 domain-containing protein [Stackebrandtia sp.]